MNPYSSAKDTCVPREESWLQLCSCAPKKTSLFPLRPILVHAAPLPAGHILQKHAVGGLSAYIGCRKSHQFRLIELGELPAAVMSQRRELDFARGIVSASANIVSGKSAAAAQLGTAISRSICMPSIKTGMRQMIPLRCCRIFVKWRLDVPRQILAVA